MSWISNLFVGSGVGHSILLLALVIGVGLIMGKLKIKGISLGVTWILFVGIIAGHFDMNIDREVLHFMKEFGLILFIFSIGLQVGPGFLQSFKRGGIQLNILAACIVVLGVAITIGIHYATNLPMQTMAGIMSGAVTNTPGLGAAQDTYYDIHGDTDPTIAMGYAVAYPLAVVGIIGSMMLIRYALRVNVKQETAKLQGATLENVAEMYSIEITNPLAFDKSISEIRDSLLKKHKFVISRVLHADTGREEIVSKNTVIKAGDKIYLAASHKEADVIIDILGKRIDMTREDWGSIAHHLMARRVLVTNSHITGRAVGELNLRNNFGVNVTRVHRSGVDLVADSDLKLQIGDRITIVGEKESIKGVTKLFGNQIKLLNEPHLIPIFLGIALGVFLGSIPFNLPGIPQPVKLGLAGGPLIVALALGIIGTKTKFITYTTQSANLMLREIGICIFLACVGLGAGEGFVDKIVNQGGFIWIFYGILITVIPLLIVGAIGRLAFRINYFTLIGMMAGSMTDPPALAYANSISETDAPSIGYASVYPLTMFMRVLAAQILILFFVV